MQFMLCGIRRMFDSSQKIGKEREALLSAGQLRAKPWKTGKAVRWAAHSKFLHVAVAVCANRGKKIAAQGFSWFVRRRPCAAEKHSC